MGKAKINNTSIDDMLKSSRERKKQFGRERANFSKVSLGNATSFGGASSSSANIQSAISGLQTSGDTMIGPIAFYPKTKIISSGTLDISQATGSGFSSRVIVTGQGGAADDLVTISGAKHAGQILFLQAVVTTDITLKHATGNIYIPSGSDYTVSGKEIVLLQYDSINMTWTLVSNFTDGSSGTWVGTATSNLDMNTYDIEGVDRLKFSAGASSSDALLSTDYGIEIEGASASPSGLKYNVPSSKTHKFYVNAGSAKMTVSSSNISFNEDLFMNSNGIYLDNDQDTYFVSTSDDNISIATGGSSRLSISDFGLYMYSDIVMNSYDIDLNGNELILDDDKDSYIQSVSDDTIQVVTSGTLRLQVDNSLVFANQDIGIITGSKLKGFFGVIGLQVSSSSLTVGSSGSLQVPYLSSTTTYSTGVNSTLDGIFGNLDGCMGIQYNSTSPTYTVWYRLNGGWRRNFLT